MPSLRDIKRRIGSVKSTQKITRAMKMVAAARLRRSQETILRARPYAYYMRDMVIRVASRAKDNSNPLLTKGMGAKISLVVVSSDRGLCGGYNSSTVAETLRLLREEFPGRDVTLTIIGRKANDILKRRPCVIRKVHTQVMDGNVLRAAAMVMDEQVALFTSGEYEVVFCLYNEFKSAISQKLTLEQLLPVDIPEGGADSGADYVYEPSAEAILEMLLGQHLHVQMHRILSEAAASEYGARMTAMDAATKNAGDVIDRLTLQYNRARQTTITKEVIEIVSGAEAAL